MLLEISSLTDGFIYFMCVYFILLFIINRHNINNKTYYFIIYNL